MGHSRRVDIPLLDSLRRGRAPGKPPQGAPTAFFPPDPQASADQLALPVADERVSGSDGCPRAGPRPSGRGDPLVHRTGWVAPFEVASVVGENSEPAVERVLVGQCLSARADRRTEPAYQVARHFPLEELLTFLLDRATPNPP